MMHCPVCGQQQISREIRFCSRCGFEMSGVTALIEGGGKLPGPKNGTKMNPRRRGIFQGLFIFLLSFLVVPLVALITIAANAEPFFVAASAIIFSVGGILRMAFALMFESSDLTIDASDEGLKSLGGATSAVLRALPKGHSIPVDAYAPPKEGAWRETNDLDRRPASVTDNTTKLLEKEEEP